jgi:tRNA pseudouridine38-40 synthase
MGEHDFGAFCRSSDRPQDTMRTVRHAKLSRRGNMLVFKITANSYLTNMVRVAVGNLISVASGRRGLEWFDMLLSGRSRCDSAKTVPPSGLFLWKVTYPEGLLIE